MNLLCPSSSFLNFYKYYNIFLLKNQKGSELTNKRFYVILKEKRGLYYGKYEERI